MDLKILVVYASKSGATAEIAEKIGEVLRQTGLKTDVFPVGDLRDIAPYQAVILGSAVYIGSWPKETEAFLKAHEKILANRPLWLFSSGPTGEGDPVQLLNGWRLPVALRPVVDRIQPRDITVFHGYINPDKLNFVQKWVINSVIKKPMGDFRDWEAIVAWTNTITVALKDAKS
jgi:menaquinone-dependent protoporphyrinogen oxidase